MNDRDYELLDAWRHGQITDDEFRDLEKRLETDVKLRTALRAMADLEEGLTNLAIQPLSLGVEAKRPMLDRRPVFAYAGWAVAATVLVLASIWSYLLTGAQPTKIATDTREPDIVETPNAVVTNQIDAEYVDVADRIETGLSPDGKWIRLAAGIVQVEFASGAKLALQGPAELRVDSDMECFLENGKLTVLAPPEASLFTVKSPSGNVIDLGTEFGIVVDANGQMDVHVLDGEVDVEVGGQQKRRLIEDQAATVDPETNQIEATAIDRESFDPIRHETLLANKPLRLQFDCGIRAGVYQGTESPGHAAGDVQANEVYWNGLIGDQSGRFVLADGSVSQMTLEIDYGQENRKPKSRRVFSWDAEPELAGSGHRLTRGIFDTALGKDCLSSGSMVGLRIKGLPVGRYRIYFIARGVDQTRRGNYLILKAYRVAIGADLHEMPNDAPAIMPLDDPDAGQWVAGQTHHVGEVKMSAADEYLTLLVRRDPNLSPQRGVGGSPIAGLQIIQLEE